MESLLLHAAAWLSLISQDTDPAMEFTRRMEQAPTDQQPPNWQEVSNRMNRKPPAVGDPAPDFSLKTLDGEQTITLSQLAGSRPVVLIFGSYT